MAATITLHVEVNEFTDGPARRFVLDTFEAVSPQIVFRPMDNRVYVSFLVDTLSPWDAVEMGAEFLLPIIEAAGDAFTSAYVQCNGIRKTLKVGRTPNQPTLRRRLSVVREDATPARGGDAVGQWQADVRQAMEDVTRELRD